MSKHAAYQQKEDERKKKAIFILVIALVAVLSIGGTLAYLTATTNTKSNVFTSTTSITASLYETAWDGSTATSTSPASDVDTNEDYGVNIARTMTPGKVAPKDPKIANTNATGGQGEYVAMRVKFLDANGNTMDQEAVNSLLTYLAVYTGSTAPTTGGITVDSNWVADSGNGSADGNDGVYYFYYNTVLDAGSSTTALFDNVMFLPSTTGTVMGTYSNFQIVVDGAAVQADSFSGYAGAETTLKGLFA